MNNNFRLLIEIGEGYQLPALVGSFPLEPGQEYLGQSRADAKVSGVAVIDMGDLSELSTAQQHYMHLPIVKNFAICPADEADEIAPLCPPPRRWPNCAPMCARPSPRTKTFSCISEAAMNEAQRAQFCDRLFSLATQHPGGYTDIYDTLRNAGSRVIEYDVVTKKAVTVEGKTEMVDHRTRHTIQAFDIADAIEYQVGGVLNQPTGFIAGAFNNILARYNLPTPSHSDWGKPAAFWF